MPTRNIVVVGASAGGIESLKRLVAGLWEDIGASFFVVQHLPRESPALLAGILDRAGPLGVSVGEDRERFQPGHIYVAPPDRHLLLSDGHLMTTRGPRENRSRPAIDPLFRSAAVAYGPQVIGVILSGTLDDGTAGLLAIKRCGGIAVVQDPDDALFAEMPQSALDNVGVDCTAKLQDMPRVLMRLTSEPSGPPVPVPRDLVLETRMAESESGDVRRTDAIGSLSAFACPECNGPLWQIDGEAIDRYRCHTGHAFTARALVEDLADATERALWVALQTMEERSRMLRRLAKQEHVRGRVRSGDRFAERAEEIQDHAGSIRALLMEQPSLADPRSDEELASPAASAFDNSGG